MNQKSPSIHKQVIEKIVQNLAEANQPLPSSLEFYHRILTTQINSGTFDTPEIADALVDKAKERLSAGKPAITFSDLTIDWNTALQLFNDLSSIAIEFLTPESEDCIKLKQAGSDSAFFKETAAIWFDNKTVSSQNITTNGVNTLTSNTLQATFSPILSAYSEKLMVLVLQERWYHRYCPICGGVADFSFLDKEGEGARWLLCSRCDSKWLFHRLECPHCGNQDQKTLAYLTDDKGLYRLYVCDKCRCYIKAIDLRKTDEQVLLPLERILTLDMDRQAQDSNYSPELRI